MTRGVAPRLGRSFGPARPFMTATSAGTGSVTQVLAGAACGALAVCGVQFLMVIMSEIELNRSVDAISE